jgi:hypothetical protein
MFAPKVAKPQTKTTAGSTNKLAHRHPTLIARPFGGGSVEQASMHQATIGNQATLRFLTQRLSYSAAKAPGEHHPMEVAKVNGDAPNRGGDFSKIPVLAPDRRSRTQPSSPLDASPIPDAIQAKLIVGEVNDRLEHEADRVADQLMRMPAASAGTRAAPLQVSCRLQNTAGSQIGAGEAPNGVYEALRMPGQPLDPESRAYFEPRFGADFSRVRIHTDRGAEESAGAVQARAYTVGQHIVFGSGQYTPRSVHGRRLLAHELTHTLQQEGGLAGVVRRDPRHDKGHAGEQAMGFGYSQEKGWIFIQGPSGAGGHGITQPGFDGIAYNIAADELHILDNKALTADTASSSTALTTNVLKNLDDAITTVRGMQDLPSRIKILGLLTRARAAVAGGTRIPRNVKLVITGEAGNVRAVSGRLAGRGLEFRESGTTDQPLAPTSPPARQAQGEIDTSPANAPPPANVKNKPKVMVDSSLEHADHKPPTVAKPVTETDVELPGTAGGGGAAPAPKVEWPSVEGAVATSTRLGPQASRLTTAGRFLAEEAPGLILQAALMALFPPEVHIHDENYPALSSQKIDPALQRALMEQADILNKLAADNAAQSIWATVTVDLDFSLNATSSGSAEVFLQDLRFIGMKITREYLLVEGKKFDTPKGGNVSKTVTYSVPIFGPATHGSEEAIRYFRKVRESLTNLADKVRVSAMLSMYKMVNANPFLTNQLIRDLQGMSNDDSSMVRDVAAHLLSHLKPER